LNTADADIAGVAGRLGPASALFEYYPTSTPVR
jgi:hypothetical protein